MSTPLILASLIVCVAAIGTVYAFYKRKAKPAETPVAGKQ